MASINTIVKRKQYLWLGIVVVGTASAIGGALYLSDVDMSGNGETVAEQEPVPDMTGVVDTTFDDKVRQHATTEMQVTAAQMQKQYEEIRRELDVLNKQRGDDQRRIEKLGQDNAALAEQVKALGANPVTATGEPVPQMSGMFCCLPLRMRLQKPGLQRLLLIIVDSVRVKGNEVVWFRQCRPKILFQLSIGQKSRYVLIISVLGYGEHRWEGGMSSVQLRRTNA